MPDTSAIKDLCVILDQQESQGRWASWLPFWNQPTPVYAAGSTVRGTVCFRLLRPMRLKEVYVFVAGEVVVPWDTADRESCDLRDGQTVMLSRKMYRAERMLATDTVFMSGTHQIPFQCQLGSRWPETFVGCHGKVTSRVRAVINVCGPPNLLFSGPLPIKVCGKLDVSTLDPFWNKPLIRARKFRFEETGCKACLAVGTQGEVEASFKLERKAFVTNDPVVIKVNIRNNANTRLRIALTLYRCTRYKSSMVVASRDGFQVTVHEPVPRQPRTEKKLVSTFATLVVPEDTMHASHEILYLPKLIPTDLGARDPSIEVTYFITMDVMTYWGFQVESLSQEIKIGTCRSIPVKVKCSDDFWNLPPSTEEAPPAYQEQMKPGPCNYVHASLHTRNYDRHLLYEESVA